MTLLVQLLALFFGLAFGSFANVIIYRTQIDGANLRTPSQCLNCGARIRLLDNIPVVSWLLLVGKCRNCKAPISATYPAVELFVASAFVLFVNWPHALAEQIQVEGLLSNLFVAVALCGFTTVGVALAVIDWRTFRLPNQLVSALYVVALAGFAASSLVSAEWSAFTRSALAALASLALYGLIVLIAPRGMGIGDLKLSGALGLFLGWFGWGTLFLGVLFSFILGAGFGLVRLAAKKTNRNSRMAFGPWMLVGAFLAILFGEPLWSSYLDSLRNLIG